MTVPSYGPKKPRLVVVGEAPGAEEEQQGRPFVGQSGKLLRHVLREAGLDDEKEVFYTNVLLVRPPDNRTPTQEEVAERLPQLLAELERFTCPVVLLGKTAKLAILNEDLPRGTWKGKFLTTWHPAYVLRKPSMYQELLADIRSAVSGLPVDMEPPPFSIVETLESHTGGTFVLDIEANNIHWYDTPTRAASACLLIGLRDLTLGENYIIPMEDIYEGRTIEWFREWAPKQRFIMHNALFDASYLERQFSVKLPILGDTMLMHYLLDENTRHGLKELAWQYLHIADYEQEFVKKYLSSRNDEYSKVPQEELMKYLSYDLYCTAALYDVFYLRLSEEGLWDTYLWLMQMTRAMYQVKLNGIQIDTDYLHQLGEEMEVEMTELTTRLRAMSGQDALNPNSPVQLAKIIWDEMGLRPNRDCKDGPRSTSAAALDHLRSYNDEGVKVREGNEFVDVLMSYRRVAKIKSSYVNNLLENVDMWGRVHPDILLHGTEVGRLSMRNPAVQTIPRPSDKYGKAIRCSVIAAPGYKLIVADYSQAELRCFAALSGEPFLLEAYREGRDLHSEVARAMFGDKFTKEQRVMCKMFNFSYIYGGSEWSFARDAGLDIERARGFVRSYNQNMPVALAWKHQQLKLLREQGYVESRTGRRRRFPLLTQDNIHDAAKAAVHMPVAGLASDLTLMAAEKLVIEGYRVVLLVHDSILVEAPAERAEQVGEWMSVTMKQVASKWVPEVPWVVDVEIGDRWYEDKA